MFSSIVIASRRKSWPMPCAMWSKKPPWSTGVGGCPSPGLVPEQEELDLRVGVEGEPEVRGLGQSPLEHLPRVGVGRLAVRQHDVAEHPRRARRLGPPGQDLEGPRVRPGQHVRLGDPGEALDRGAVEADALVEGAFELGRRHRHRLEEAEHVGEPEPDEADVALLEGAEHELLLLVHDGDRAAPVFPPVLQGRSRSVVHRAPSV